MITVQNLSKYYGDVKALDVVSCECKRDEIVVIIGSSGCGKTTLLRLIAGLETPDAGQIAIENMVVSTSRQSIEPHKRQVSLVFQDLALWPHMTVKEHIDFVLPFEKLKKGDIRLATESALSDVNLRGYENRYPHELSGGEQQRLAIARAIASKPRYLLMDEPFSSLDSILKENLFKLMLRLKKEKSIGLICVTHNIDEVNGLADRIAVMKNGQIVQFDSKENIMNNPKNEFVSSLLKLRR